MSLRPSERCRSCAGEQADGSRTGPLNAPLTIRFVIKPTISVALQEDCYTASEAPSRIDSVNLGDKVDNVNSVIDDRSMPNMRDTLIDAATVLLDAGGPAAVTLREVGRRAGVSHNAPYHHFVDKEDLLAAIAIRELARPRLSANGDGPATTARDIMLDYTRWALHFPARFKLVFGRWETINSGLATVANEAYLQLLTVVTVDQRLGHLPDGDAERLAALLLATAHGAVDQSLSGHLAEDGKGHASPADVVGDLFRYLDPGVTALHPDHAIDAASA